MQAATLNLAIHLAHQTLNPGVEEFPEEAPHPMLETLSLYPEQFSKITQSRNQISGMGRFDHMISTSNNFDVVVIGSGPAGQNAAMEAAQRDARVLIIEQEPQVGGACVQYGTIPSKTLRETALTLTAFQRRSGDVYRISRDAELSICSLMKRLNEVVHAHQETTRRFLEQSNVERALRPRDVCIDS
jgi:hypothetical protein